MTIQLDQINFLAVIVVAILSMVIGFLWYSPFLFGNLWLRLIGKTADEIEGQASDYIASLVSAFIAALILAVFIEALGITDAGNGILVGLLVGVGFSATSTLTYSTFEGPPYSVWALYTVYQLIWYAVGGILLAVWQ